MGLEGRPRRRRTQPRPLLLLLGLFAVAAVAALLLGRAQRAALYAAPAPRQPQTQPQPQPSRPQPQPQPQPQPARHGAVYLRWSMGGGLCNQLSSHVNGLTIAMAMGADAAILPHTKHRANFNHTWPGGSWKPAHISTLLDMERMQREWRAQGLEVLEGPLCAAARAAAPWLNCTVAGSDAFAPPPGSRYLQGNLFSLVSKLRLTLGDVWARHGPETCMLVEAGNLFNALDTSSTGNLTVAAAAGLRFHRRVEELAAKVAEAMGPAFNGAHLRLERDMGLDAEVSIPQYIDAMRAVSFNASTPLYVASGLLGYNDTAMFDGVARRLCGAGLCSRAVAKEHILSAADLDGLHSEQLALLDLLVLVRSAALVGTNVSTLSLFVRDYRALRGGGSQASVRLLGDQERDRYLRMQPAPAWP